MKTIWVEKYRPTKISEYVFRDELQKRTIQGWINDKSIPHLLFAGSAGTGKTTLARVLVNELGVQPADLLFINATRENGIEYVRYKITSFSETQPWGDFKIVLLDEADYLSPDAQAALRGVMEQYHASVRFILTCNYDNKIIPAIKSRCQVFQIQKQDETAFFNRMVSIMEAEGVKYDPYLLGTYVVATQPDMRKTINNLQANTINGELTAPDASRGDDSAWLVKMVDLFKSGNIRDARKLIVANARPDEYEGIFRKLYENLEWFGDTPNKQDEAVIIIRNGLVKHVSVADVEINLSATLIELQMI
jgi:DNA polymerase III delta prime subunit|tara:strand:+ start:3681 stop:4598 length:918 start_codon:yes stop_codon:yes gene_type:complete